MRIVDSSSVPDFILQRIQPPITNTHVGVHWTENFRLLDVCMICSRFFRCGLVMAELLLMKYYWDLVHELILSSVTFPVHRLVLPSVEPRMRRTSSDFWWRSWFGRLCVGLLCCFGLRAKDCVLKECCLYFAAVNSRLPCSYVLSCWLY